MSEKRERAAGYMSYAWGWWNDTIQSELGLAAMHGMGHRSNAAFAAVALFMAEFGRTHPDLLDRFFALLRAETDGTSAFRPAKEAIDGMAADLTALLDERPALEEERNDV